MVTLLEINEIVGKYKFDVNGKIQLTIRGEREKAKDVSQLTEEEKIDISCAIFLFNAIGYKNLNEEFLEQAQTQFITQALNSNEYNIGIGATDIFQKSKEPCYNIWTGIIEEKGGAMTYFNKVLAENGKKIQMLQRNGMPNLKTGIKYNLIEDSKAKFKQSLDPNNAIYIKNTKPKVLTLEQRQRRRKFVNKFMQVYREYEEDADYDIREETEENDMRLIGDMKGFNGRIAILDQHSTSIARVMNLLYAAKNLSLVGQADYIEILIEQPQINEFLLKLKKHGTMDIIEKSLQERRDKGTLIEHKPTHMETANREANQLISEQPNVVGEAKKYLNGLGKELKILKGDKENLRKAYLTEIVGLTMGKYVVRSIDSQGNKILKVDRKQISR